MTRSDWKNQWRVVIPLALAATVVWGMVGYTLFGASREAGPDVTTVASRASEAVEVVSHVWSDDFRDPFGAPSIAAAPVGPRVSTPVADEPALPSLRLIGIVDGTAMIELEDGTIALAGRGEGVGEALVLAITSTSVALSAGGHRHTLTLD